MHNISIIIFQPDHDFRSKWLVDELCRLGFSISYSKLKRRKKSVTVNHFIENSFINVYPKVLTQPAGDNVDHSIRTSNGSGASHAMEIIAISMAFPKHLILTESDRISGSKDIKSDGLS